jgi:hypothetical protein
MASFLSLMIVQKEKTIMLSMQLVGLNRLLYYCRGDVIIIFVILSEGGGRVEGSFGSLATRNSEHTTTWGRAELLSSLPSASALLVETHRSTISSSKIIIHSSVCHHLHQQAAAGLAASFRRSDPTTVREV